MGLRGTCAGALGGAAAGSAASALSRCGKVGNSPPWASGGCCCSALPASASADVPHCAALCQGGHKPGPGRGSADRAGPGTVLLRTGAQRGLSPQNNGRACHTPSPSRRASRRSTAPSLRCGLCAGNTHAGQIRGASGIRREASAGVPRHVVTRASSLWDYYDIRAFCWADDRWGLFMFRQLPSLLSHDDGKCMSPSRGAVGRPIRGACAERSTSVSATLHWLGPIPCSRCAALLAYAILTDRMYNT